MLPEAEAKWDAVMKQAGWFSSERKAKMIIGPEDNERLNKRIEKLAISIEHLKAGKGLSESALAFIPAETFMAMKNDTEGAVKTLSDQLEYYQEVAKLPAEKYNSKEMAAAAAQLGISIEEAYKRAIIANTQNQIDKAVASEGYPGPLY